VIELGTFSKTLAPGLRIAWIVAPKPVIARLVQIKQGTDLHTSTFNQMVIYEVAKDGFLDEHIANLRTVYRKRRDAMLAALDQFMPSEVEWTHPDGGLFLWVKFPQGTNVRALFEAAVQRNVAFVPGDTFFVRPDAPPTARLNFSCMDEDRIREGIRRLAETIAETQHASPTV
jgi:2-aminoadipate transaminase